MAVAVAALAVGSAAGPASASVSIKARDKVGDVRLTRAGGAPTNAVRKGIDIRRVEVAERPDAVRFAVQMRRYVKTKKFHQMVFIDLDSTYSNTDWAEIGWSPQAGRRSAYAAAHDIRGDDMTHCTVRRMRTNAATDTLQVDVPLACIPNGPGTTITVTTMTGLFRTDAPLKSVDRLRLPGEHALFTESPQ